MERKDVGPSLLAALATVPDPRRRRGRRHPLLAILALATAAMLSDARSLYAIWQRGRLQDPAVVAALGFTRAQTPAVSTLHEVFTQLDAPAFEQAVQTWAQAHWAVQYDKGHGRREVRRLWASTALAGYLDWSGAQQVCKVERRCTRCGAVTTEVRDAITSLSAAVGADRLLAYKRGRWGIENRSHWVRDVTFDEDRSPVRSGSIPEVMAALRNLAIGTLRSAGATNIAAAGRYHAAHPAAALALIGIETIFK